MAAKSLLELLPHTFPGFVPRLQVSFQEENNTVVKIYSE